jgi:dUTP pyrophosphatase
MKKIKIVNKSDNPNPSYETKNSAGMDLRANEDCIIHGIKSKHRTKINTHVISTGIYISLPKGYEAQIRSRSGLAAKNNVIVLNSPGTIDADYRGEIKIILSNLSINAFHVKKGDRIAQMIIAPYERIGWKDVDTLDKTKRGSGGLGSTGKR